MLFHLSQLSLHSARSEKQHQRDSGRLKNLPNISFHMELMLIHAGITDVKNAAYTRGGKELVKIERA